MSEYYKGFRKEQVSTQGAVALQAPSTQGAQRDNAMRTQLLTQSIDSLVSVGTAAVGAADRKIKTARAEKGAIEAGEGKENSAGTFTWGGAEQTEAYNKVRGEAAVRDMPSYIDNFMRNDPENSKAFDEMSTEERNVAYARARQSFFKEKGIEGSPFHTESAFVANQIQESHLKYMDKQAADLRQSKSETLLQQSMSTIMGTTGGRADEVESQLTSRMDEFSKMVGGTSKAQELIAQGLLSEVTSDDPMRSTAALSYLKSDQARSRFSDFKDYDQVVQQAETFNQKAKNAILAERRTEDEMGFYKYLSNGGFASEDQVNGYLENTILDEKMRFNLRNKAMSHLDTVNKAASLRDAFTGRRADIINSAPNEVREQLFFEQVGDPSSFDLRNIGSDLKMENAFVNWLQDGYEVPDFIKSFGNADLYRSLNSNGDMDALDGQLKAYTRLKARVGPLANKVFDSDQQGKLELYGRLKKDIRYANNHPDLIQRLDEYDAIRKKDAAGHSKYMEIKNELTGKEFNMSEKFGEFATEGGTAILSGPDDLQPLLTFSEMSPKDDSAPSFTHAKQTMEHNYVIYRASGLQPKDAQKKAQEDFQQNYQWVVWNDGRKTNSYIPREFGSNFAKDSYKFLDSNMVPSKIAKQEGITKEEARKGISIHPSQDFAATRQLQVYFNGVPKNIKFDQQQFASNVSVILAGEKAELQLWDETMRDSGGHQKDQSTLMRIRQLYDSFDFTNKEPDPI